MKDVVYKIINEGLHDGMFIKYSVKDEVYKIINEGCSL